MDKVLIFGNDHCPFTTAARRHYAAHNIPFEYKDITHDAAARMEMQRYSGDSTRVPVIVENGRVTVGYQGGA